MATHGPLTYRQRDLAAAMRAAKQAEFPVRRIYIERDGRIVIEAGQPCPTEEAPAGPQNEWDRDRDKI